MNRKELLPNPRAEGPRVRMTRRDEMLRGVGPCVEAEPLRARSHVMGRAGSRWSGCSPRRVSGVGDGLPAAACVSSDVRTMWALPRLTLSEAVGVDGWHLTDQKAG